MEYLQLPDMSGQLLIPISTRKESLAKNIKYRANHGGDIEAAGIGRQQLFTNGRPIEENIRRLLPHINGFRIPEYPKYLDPAYLNLLRIPRPDLIHKFDAIFPVNEIDIFARYLAIIEFFTEPSFQDVSSEYGTGRFYATFDKVTEQKRALILSKYKCSW